MYYRTKVEGKGYYYHSVDLARGEMEGYRLRSGGMEKWGDAGWCMQVNKGR